MKDRLILPPQILVVIDNALALKPFFYLIFFLFSFIIYVPVRLMLNGLQEKKQNRVVLTTKNVF